MPLGSIGLDVLDGPKDWLRLKYHPLAPPKCAVIYSLMPILRESSQIMNVDTYLFLPLSLVYDTMRKRPIEKIGEYRDDVEYQN